MTTEQAEALRRLLDSQDIASLGTLHDGDPFVSMTPFALLPAGQGIVIHVSRLATHTRDMQEHDRVSIMVMGRRAADVLPQAVERVTLQGRAMTCTAESALYESARTAYLQRFPHAEPIFGFGDFSLVIIQPQSFRFIGGFAQAWSGSAQSYVRAMAGQE